MRIYITGIDGAGKSTIIENLKKSVFQDNNVSVVWARYQPKLIKLLVRPFKKSKTSGSTNFNDMNENQYNSWSSFKSKITKNKFLSGFIFFIQYFEYWFSIKRVEKLIKSKSEIVIVDRFILDFIVDQSVNHKLTQNNWIVRKLLSRLSIFDFIIFMDVNEDVAFARKDDIPSTEYLTVRRSYYKKYIKLLENAFVIENNTSINQAILEIEQVIK